MLNGPALAMTLGQRIVLTGGGPRHRSRRCEATCQGVIVSQVRVHNFSVSLDGFGTGAGQSLDAPFGHAGTRLHEWFFPTRTFREMQGQPGGSTGIDDAFARACCGTDAQCPQTCPIPRARPPALPAAHIARRCSAYLSPGSVTHREQKRPVIGR